MATLATFIYLPVSIPLGAISLAGVSVNGVATVLTKKYQKKLTKVTTLTDIIMPALAVFERCVSKALRNGKIDEEEFNLLQMLHLKTLGELPVSIAKWRQKTETNSKKPTERDKRNKEKHRNKSLIVCSLCYFTSYFKNGQDLLPT